VGLALEFVHAFFFVETNLPALLLDRLGFGSLQFGLGQIPSCSPFLRSKAALVLLRLTLRTFKISGYLCPLRTLKKY
jgi:hypothetical protein